MSDLAPVLKQRFFDANGLPLAGGLLYSFAAGTTTPLATYTDQSGLTPNTNPVVLDSGGYGNVWLGANTYKFALYDANSNLQFTEDNVQSISSQIASLTSSFQSVSVSYTQLQTAGLTNAIPLFTLAANTILKSIVIKHSTAFTGGSISALNAQVGPSGSFQNFIENFNILQAPGNGVYDNALIGIPNFASQIIYLNAVAVGANLSSLSQGTLKVWYEIANLS